MTTPNPQLRTCRHCLWPIHHTPIGWVHLSTGDPRCDLVAIPDEDPA